MNPKVFVSHASEDKERFVLEFATKLREQGVDAWLDKWEMLPGDSLIDKIFEEGLKEADAVIIVLSDYSVDKPWVREELNLSIINKLSKGTKIIPIVLDSCSVPESLRATLWEPINNLNSYENNFKRIISSIFGTTDKPALGKSPIYTSNPYKDIGRLAKIDNIVLKEACDFLINSDNGFNSFNPDELFENGAKVGFSISEIKDSIEILENNNYFNVQQFMGGGEDCFCCRITVTGSGFEEYLQAYYIGYNLIIEKVTSAIVNEKITNNSDIISKLTVPKVVINHILLDLESSNHIKLVKSPCGHISIRHISASLRRALA